MAETIYALVINYEEDYDAADVHGAFATLREAQDHAREYRVQNRIPQDSEQWQDAGWSFQIAPLKQPRRAPRSW